MTPKQLDYILNGAKVFIYKRFDGKIYASVHDFQGFGHSPVELVRVKLDENSTVESVESDPAVAKRISALTSHDGRDAK
jgi:hypothetical protein